MRALPPALADLLPALGIAALVLALPPLGAALGGVPLTELLHVPLTQRAWDPLGPNPSITRISNGLALLLLALGVAFARPRRRAARRVAPPVRGRVPRFAWLGVLALLLAVMAAEGGAVNALIGLVTLSLAVFANADTERRTGNALLTRHRGYFWSLGAASLAAGWLFEWLNLYLQLWTYPAATEPVPYMLGRSLHYAALLPALLSLRQWLASFPPLLGAVVRAKPLGAVGSTPQEGWIIALVAVLGLAGAALWPDWIYPLTLSAPMLLAIAVQQIRGRATPVAGIAAGDWSRILLPALAALLLGLLAQVLNALLGPAWDVRLPLLGGPALLGLPLPAWVWIGLLGPFGVWLGDQLAAPWRSKPQPPPRTRFPVRIEIGGGP